MSSNTFVQDTHVTGTTALASDTAMCDTDTPSLPIVNSTYTAISSVPILTAPPLTPFSSLSNYEQSQIHRSTTSIANAWSLVSPASAFPAQYHPDPDPNNWGLPQLDAIQRLAKMTCTSAHMAEAVGFVVGSVERENEGLSAVEGDWVIRVEDVEWAIAKMRYRVNTYRPVYPKRRRAKGKATRDEGYGRLK